MAELKGLNKDSKTGDGKSIVVESIELGRAMGVTSGLLTAAEIVQRVVMEEAAKSPEPSVILLLSNKIVEEIMNAAKTP